ncbi:MAG: nuclear export factor [Conexibacter sp.]|nr:nuclear export factor [Conexibacter sp.]
MQRRSIAGVTAALALGLPAAAQAHVTLQPNSAAAGSFTVLDVRVPTERDDASTVKVDLRLPPGFASVAVEQQPGWTVKVIKTKLAKPIQTDDGPVIEAVSELIWSGSGRGLGAIPPGAFKDFPISVQIPGKAGPRLTFKALQTYSNGAVVRWIGAPDSAQPAPQVALTPAAPASGAAAPATTTATPAPAAAATGNAPVAAQHGDVASKGLGVAALIAGLLGLLLGATATFLATRRNAGGRTG